MLNAIQNKILVIAEDKAEPIGVMFLQTTDLEFWPDKINDKSYYIHKLCVQRPFAKQGISKLLIEWAYEKARRESINFLRLDCAPRKALMNLYQQSGFKEIDRIEIPATKANDGSTIPSFITVRFERKIA